MNPPEEQRDSAAQLTISLVDTASQEADQGCQDIFSPKTNPVPASHDEIEVRICRSLPSQPDALLSVLRKTQTVDNLSACYNSWRIVCEMLDTKEDDQPATPEQRLFVKLLLRHIDLLCSSTAAVYPAFDGVCKSLSRERQDSPETIQGMARICTLVANMMSVYARLLMQTRRETPIRSMARILGCLHSCFKSACAGILSGAVAPEDIVGRSLQRVCKIAPVVMERIVAAVPAECVVDDTAGILIASAYRVPMTMLNPSSTSNRSIAREQCLCDWPPTSLPVSDMIMRQLLSQLLSKSLTLNKKYLISMMSDTQPVCHLYEVDICREASSCLFCLLSLSLCRHNTLLARVL